MSVDDVQALIEGEVGEQVWPQLEGELGIETFQPAHRVAQDQGVVATQPGESFELKTWLAFIQECEPTSHL